MSKTSIDNGIVVMRFLAITLIVFHHSIIVFCGWPPSDITSMGVPSLIAFLSDFAKSYGLGIFTFISGFLLANSKQKHLSWKFISHKAKKILLPCAIAAIVYYIYFLDFSNSKFDTVNGTHLWYLPMIFIFYLSLPVVQSNNLKRIILFSIIFMLSNFLLYKMTGFRTFNACLHFFCYFIAGVVFNKFFWGGVNIRYLYVALFIAMLSEINNLQTPLAVIVLTSGLYCILHFLLSSNFFISFLVNNPITYLVIKQTVVAISAQSFYIYIYHQFIIDLLIEFVPRDIPFFRFYLFIACFTLSLVIPICIISVWHFIKTHLNKSLLAMRSHS